MLFGEGGAVGFTFGSLVVVGFATKGPSEFRGFECV